LHVSQRVMPRVADLLVALPSEAFLPLIVAICLCVTMATAALGLSLELGAFVAGLMLTDTPLTERALSAVEPLVHVFGGMYFSAVGLIINPMYVLEHAVDVIRLVIIVLAVKLAVVSAAMRWARFSTNVALVAGVLMAQIGEYSLLFTGHAHSIGIISRQLYLNVLAAAVLTMATAPLFVRMLPFDVHLALVSDRHNVRGGSAPLVFAAAPGVSASAPTSIAVSLSLQPPALSTASSLPADAVHRAIPSPTASSVELRSRTQLQAADAAPPSLTHRRYVPADHDTSQHDAADATGHIDADDESDSSVEVPHALRE
jgi:hypothetical protein